MWAGLHLLSLPATPQRAMSHRRRLRRQSTRHGIARGRAMSVESAGWEEGRIGSYSERVFLPVYDHQRVKVDVAAGVADASAAFERADESPVGFKGEVVLRVQFNQRVTGIRDMDVRPAATEAGRCRVGFAQVPGDPLRVIRHASDALTLSSPLPALKRVAARLARRAGAG